MGVAFQLVHNRTVYCAIVATDLHLRVSEEAALPNLEWTSPNDSNSALDGPRVLHGGGERRKSTKSIRKLEPVLLPVLAEAREQASKGLAT